MADPIILFYRYTWKEAFHQLSEEEQKALVARLEEGRNKVGAKLIVHCHSRWASEQWRGFGVEEYSSLEALQEFSKWQDEMNLFRYMTSETMLGNKVE
jgi:hypothetical protein